MAHADNTAFDIAELLEREEKRAKDRVATLNANPSDKIKADPDGDNDSEMGGMYAQRPPSPRRVDEPAVPRRVRDPLRLDRPDFVADGTTKNRYTEERDENDERRARRSQGRGDDDAANGASDKDSANGSGRMSRRGGTRSRSPNRPGSRSSGGYRVRDGRQGRDDAGSYYRPDGRRYPSPERGGRRRSHGRYSDDERNGGRRDDRGGRRDDRGGRRDDRGGRDSRRSPHGGGRKRKTPEPTDDERDRRTVFVQQLAARLRTKQLREFFEQGAGTVVDAQIVKDRVSQRSKG